MVRRFVAANVLAHHHALQHGGWGFLFEPVLFGLTHRAIVERCTRRGGALFGFLPRRPMKLALQEATRGRSYPRTPYCRALCRAYLGGAALSLTAVMMSGARVMIPLGLVAPLALTQVLYDAQRRERELLPELRGAAAMASLAAAWPASRLTSTTRRCAARSRRCSASVSITDSLDSCPFCCSFSPSPALATRRSERRRRSKRCDRLSGHTRV